MFRATRTPVIVASALVGSSLAALALSGFANDRQTALAAPAPAPAAQSGAYEIDLLHSSILFKIKHLGAANFYGVFNKFSGDVTLGESASLNVVVDADSVETRNDGRNKHVTGPDFFAAKEFPKMTFKAASLKAAGEGSWKGSGELTFRGVTKPIELTLTKTGTGKNRGGKDVVGVETSVKIKRTDFKNDYMIGPLSDDVEIIVALEVAAK